MKEICSLMGPHFMRMVAQDAAGCLFFRPLSSPLRLLLLQKPRGSAVGNPNTGNDGVLCPFFFFPQKFGFRSFVALAAIRSCPLFVLRAPMRQHLRNQHEFLLRRRLLFSPATRCWVDRDVLQTAALLFANLIMPLDCETNWFFFLFLPRSSRRPL